MEFKQIKEKLKSLITDKTTPEQATEIGALAVEIDNKEREHGDILVAHEDLRKKYISAIQHTAFPEVSKEDATPKPKTLEECIREAQEKSKEK